MEKRIRPYELLVRVNADGTVPAHVGYIEEIVDGTSVLFAKELPVQPLDLAGPEFGAVVDALNVAAFGEMRRLSELLAAVEAELSALRHTLSE